MTKGPCPTPN
ncbi:f316b7c0-ba51-4109-9804-e09a97a0dc3e [Thermothielavioides terrestris]|uniref:F316b7c0-ba51-4109-9804-e09a97a0dc3e n=1 Tax=Thermothielavioides terrestris TaxID=2587410 RepID=A0A446BHQ4_9PEZI|nr:f316b7c0-ba51-4109-9804-e09a97a0dc3e [Thermothielavioides terrestris]